MFGKKRYFWHFNFQPKRYTCQYNFYPMIYIYIGRYIFFYPKRYLCQYNFASLISLKLVYIYTHQCAYLVKTSNTLVFQPMHKHALFCNEFCNRIWRYNWKIWEITVFNKNVDKILLNLCQEVNFRRCVKGLTLWNVSKCSKICNFLDLF